MTEYFVAQDRWCAVCNQPAALVVIESDAEHQRARTLGTVCSQAHGEQLIEMHKARAAAEFN